MGWNSLLKSFRLGVRNRNKISLSYTFSDTFTALNQVRGLTCMSGFKTKQNKKKLE